LTESPALVEVRVVGIPLDVYRESAEHSDDLQREFALIRNTEPSDDHRDVPTRLLALIAELGERFSGFTVEQQRLISEALERGETVIDLVYHVPVEIRQAVIDLGILLDEADEFCRRGDELLTLATPPRAAAFRRWFLEEFVRQADGQPPLTWEEYEAKA
jgi:hypothetical protein